MSPPASFHCILPVYRTNQPFKKVGSNAGQWVEYMWKGVFSQVGYEYGGGVLTNKYEAIRTRLGLRQLAFW